MGDLRGLKRDVWEGGHRVPLIIKWPGHVKKGAVSDMLFSQIDLMATLTAALGIKLSGNTATDSYNLLPGILGEETDLPAREVLIHNTFAKRWAVRKGNWLYINDKTGQHTEMPESFKKIRGYSDFETEGLLFNLKDDTEQRVNLFEQYPEKVKEMERLIIEEKAKGYLLKDK
jgi:arylsulfatase A-like enzyme